MKRAWVYILKCADGTYYTGSTTGLEARVVKHQLGYYGGYTAARRPVTLMWSEQFANIKYAIAAERQIKGWSRRKKEALMRGDFDLLHELAQSTEVRERRKRKS